MMTLTRRTSLLCLHYLLLLTGTTTIITGFVLQLGFHRGHREQLQENLMPHITIMPDSLREPHASLTIWGLDQVTWSNAHKMVIVLFLVFTTYHAIKHAKWYRNVFSGKPIRKNKQTIVLSFIFILVTLTGLLPWWMDTFEYASAMRFFLIEVHDKISLFLTIYLMLHVIKRFGQHQ